MKQGISEADRPTPAVPYYRVSTEEQAESRLGLEAQAAACLAFAERAGYALAEALADEGIGGAEPLAKRPGLMAAIDAVAVAGVLMVAKRDRLGRDPILVAMVEATLARKKARVVSAAGEGTDGDGPSDVLMRRMVDAFSEYERLVIKARTVAALGAKRRRGERTGQVPLGRRVDPGDDRRSKSGQPAALVVDEEELAVVGWIQQARADGWSLRSIARDLDRRGVPTKNGGEKWAASTIDYLLRTRG